MRNLISKLRTPAGSIILSIILGLGLASIFKRTCTGDNCRVFRAPSVDKLKGKVFKKNGKCYEMREQEATCSKSKKIFEFEHD
jgi:hypothetical protein